ncbi:MULTISPECIES: IS110 family transposase [unclassified Mesorhizobium]|uniref:IS110 family transposase n=1 Tax=unclassified Mesorhizobium TaxID=325217 RepID=UPI001FE15395|nr:MULTISPECIES: IS110 family transposase [unclassified Mesorhizobium]
MLDDNDIWSVSIRRRTRHPRPGSGRLFAGLAPVARQSGRWAGHAFIRGGRANVRQALYTPALVACALIPISRLNAISSERQAKPQRLHSPPS